MAEYEIKGKKVTQAEFQNYNTKQNKITRNKNILIASFFGISIGAVVYGYNKQESAKNDKELKQAKLIFTLGIIGALTSFVLVKVNNDL